MCALTESNAKAESQHIEVLDDAESEKQRLKAEKGVQTNDHSAVKMKQINIQSNGLNVDDRGGSTDTGQRAQSPHLPRKEVTIAVNLSFFINVVLLVTKAIAFAMTFSYAVIAALVDSVLDLLSQFIICITERKVRDTKKSDKYPVGLCIMVSLILMLTL